MLPPAGSELQLQWMSVEEASILQDIEWKILTVQPAMTEEGTLYGKEAEAQRVKVSMTHLPN